MTCEKVKDNQMLGNISLRRRNTNEAERSVQGTCYAENRRNRRLAVKCEGYVECLYVDPVGRS